MLLRVVLEHSIALPPCKINNNVAGFANNITILAKRSFPLAGCDAAKFLKDLAEIV